MTTKTLKKLKLKELKALAKQNKIKGFSKMRKADLMLRIQGLDNIEELVSNLVIPEKKKRVMSEKQKEALAKGRAKMMLKRGLKIKAKKTVKKMVKKLVKKSIKIVEEKKEEIKEEVEESIPAPKSLKRQTAEEVKEEPVKIDKKAESDEDDAGVVVSGKVRFNPAEFRQELKADKGKRLKGMMDKAKKFNKKKKGLKNLLE